ncbi:hypothetical protein PYCCODRAFT_1008167 [Trametes coccinea BRFM310]|uniref:Uncharacterized protein n=1 Tax=Trametes coccinea (strain BRFM310) TaxID=1353009 RepID=A0A1Y2IB71_TRAC3|nr:hypothetical protein PYCCODRAFT_1008167 [Trametes coccinea BRFM310]
MLCRKRVATPVSLYLRCSLILSCSWICTLRLSLDIVLGSTRRRHLLPRNLHLCCQPVREPSAADAGLAVKPSHLTHAVSIVSCYHMMLMRSPVSNTCARALRPPTSIG